MEAAGWMLRYRAFCDEVRLKNVVMPEQGGHITFVVPMPKSWSQKKRVTMNGQAHQQKPDADNMIKALMDALYADDAHIWDLRVTKLWGVTGQILISDIGEVGPHETGSIVKAFQPQGMHISDDVKSTSPNRLNGTDIMTGIGVTSSRARFGLAAFFGKTGISKTDEQLTVQALARHAIDTAPKTCERQRVRLWGAAA